ncbi:hypothetical protein KKC52_00500 [bacterium]|nr:hypothetical protein [bacterium]
MTDQDRYWTYFDEAWKKIVERFFPELLGFFVPNTMKMWILQKESPS